MNIKKSGGRETVSKTVPKRDVIVSVKLPTSLVNELRDLQQINHFMDLSDEIRFIVRRYCFNVLNKNLSSSKSIDASLYSDQIESLVHEKEKKDQVIADLTKILNNLRNNDLSNLSNLKNNPANQNNPNHQND